MDKQKWIDRALELGIDGFEITQSHQRSREVEWFEGTMDSFSTSKIISTSMRALIDGKIVSTALEKVDDAKMDETLNGLKEAALLISESEKDELVPPMETEMVQSKWKWIEPAVPQILDTLQSLEEKLLAADSRVTMVNSLGFTSGFGQSQMNNSLGVDIHESSGIQALFAQITMQDDGDLRDGYVYEIVENLDDLDQDALVQKLIDKVAFQLHAKSLKSQVCPVIINYEAMSTLLSAFAPMFSGSLIEKGISPLSQSLGKQVFSDKITIIDDPKNTEAISLSNYDDEGYPTRTKVVVDKGVFETILHNTRSAKKMGATSTGNGFKSGGGGTDVSPMNLYIVPGQDSFDTLLKTMDNGVVITELAGMHAGIDFVSTNFSLQAKGYGVENGQKGRPLTLITIAGNFLEMMNNIVAVGDDLKWEMRSIASPSILFASAAIGGTEN